MANEEQEQQNQQMQEDVTPAALPKSKSKFNPKILIIGLPVFIIQLIAVYFITANILIKKMDSRAEGKDAKSEQQVEDNSAVQDSQSLGEHIFQIDDIIVNPAYTNGDQLLLSSIAFDVTNETSLKELEKKQILVKDIVISLLSSKSINQLGNVSYKDTLRTEISEKVSETFSDVKINRVYFSKYIIN